jgi:drug/metabolite transporter (DMT)-like permease
MEVVLWGLGTAFGWGFADFFARYTSRAFGTARALAVMLLTSSVVLTVIFWLRGEALSWRPDGLVFVGLGGLGVVFGTAFLYWGLARGPVSLVSPIVASYPAFNLALAVALGVALSAEQWALILLTMAGVATVSRGSKGLRSLEEHSPEALTKSAFIAVTSALGFAGGLAALQFAAPYYGEWGTLVLSRWVSAGMALLWLVATRPGRGSVGARAEGALVPLGALLLLQGLLDGGAYLSLLYGSHGAGAAIVVVVASCFTLVTILLGRIFLKERMALTQKLGVVMVVGGVAGLSYLGA